MKELFIIETPKGKRVFENLNELGLILGLLVKETSKNKITFRELLEKVKFLKEDKITAELEEGKRITVNIIKTSITLEKYNQLVNEISKNNNFENWREKLYNRLFEGTKYAAHSIDDKDRQAFLNGLIDSIRYPKDLRKILEDFQF